MGRFIDMDKLVLPKGTVDKIQKKGVPAILDWLAEQESIEVIRCKDCKYGKVRRNNNGILPWCDKYCVLDRVFMQSNDYCSYGERKETE